MWTGNRLMLAALLKIELPGHTILFSEGTEIEYLGDIYTSEDSRYGTIVEVDEFVEGEADESPSLEITFAPRSDAAALELSNPTFQKSPMSAWIAVINRDTGLVIDTEPLFVGLVDYTTLIGSGRERRLNMGFSTEIERFFNTDKGNQLNSNFHKRIWPNERGLDNATSSTRKVPWGRELS